MIRFLKNSIAPPSQVAQPLTLGRLEFDLMQILWSRGESNVRDVVQKLDRSLAYTTVMTTLDRLYKKGLLNRRRQYCAFVYSARFSQQEWEHRRAESIVARFLARAPASRDLLLSCLLDAVGKHDAVLLDELEKKIRNKRKELFKQRQS